MLAASPEDHGIKAWIDNLPYRWAAGGALTTGVSLALLTVFGLGEPAIKAALILTGATLAATSWLLTGYWARWSIQPHFQRSLDSARASIPHLWASGAVLLAGLPLVLRRLFAELGAIESPSSGLAGFIELIAAMACAYLLGRGFAFFSQRGFDRAVTKHRSAQHTAVAGE